MKVLSKWIPRLYFIATFFWAIIHLISKYSKTIVVDETVNTMPIPILIVLVILISIVTFGGAVVLILTYWETIKKDKLSFVTFAPISLLMLGVIVLGKLGITKIYVLVEKSVEQFLSDLLTYDSSLTSLLWILGSGFIVGALGFAWEKINAT